MIYLESSGKVFKLFNNISFDKQLYPAIALKDKNDSVEIITYKTEYYSNNKLVNEVNGLVKK